MGGCIEDDVNKGQGMIGGGWSLYKPETGEQAIATKSDIVAYAQLALWKWNQQQAKQNKAGKSKENEVTKNADDGKGGLYLEHLEGLAKPVGEQDKWLGSIKKNTGQLNLNLDDYYNDIIVKQADHDDYKVYVQVVAGVNFCIQFKALEECKSKNDVCWAQAHICEAKVYKGLPYMTQGAPDQINLATDLAVDCREK